MKRRNFVLATVGGVAAIAGCYALSEAGVVDVDDVRDRIEDLADSDTEPGASSDPAIAIRDSEFVPGSGSPGDRGSLRLSVENVGGVRLSSIDLQTQFFDADGRRVRGSFRSLSNLDPSETWRVRHPYPGAGTEVDGHVVSGSFVPGSSVTDPGDLSMVSDHFAADECVASVGGVVRNDGLDAAPYVQVLAKFYSADDAVVASAYDHVLDLDAGARWNYSVDADATALDEPPVRHEVELSGPWW